MSSIFKKQFIMYTSILILNFILLGTGITNGFTDLIRKEKINLLINQGKKIAKVFEQAYYLGGIYNKEKLEEEIEVLDLYLDSSFIFLDGNQTISIISNDVPIRYLGRILDFEDIKKNTSHKDIFYMEGNLNGIFENLVFTVAYPIEVDDVFMGTILMSTPLTEIQQIINSGFKIIIIFILSAIILGFILIYIFSMKITKPLLEMNTIAKVISNGDFEKRIDVNSNDEIGQLADSFNGMAESLHLQEQRRKDFISNISHDLRSPLTSMKGFLQAILDGTIPSEKQERYLKIILEESERLATLANNIIDINNLDDSITKINIEEFELNNVIKKIVLTLEQRLAGKSINLNVIFNEDETFVIADEGKIKRVIYNLLDNAIKFSNNNSEIIIKVYVKDKKVYVSIKDFGKGLTLDEQKRVFDRFYKADSSRGLDKIGSGLGLSIVKDLIRAHGEKIFLKSCPGEWTEFTFTLSKNE